MRPMSVIVKPLKGEAMTRNRAEVPQEKKKNNWWIFILIIFDCSFYYSLFITSVANQWKAEYVVWFSEARLVRKWNVNFGRHAEEHDQVNVKQSRNRPGVAQRVPGGLGSHISWHSAHEGGEVVSLTHRPPLSPESVPGTHFH